MLKHATINRTSRAQQTLQLQRQCQLNQQQSPIATVASGEAPKSEQPPQEASQFSSKLESQSIANNDEETTTSSVLAAGMEPRTTTPETSTSPIRSITSPSPNPSVMFTPTHRAQRLNSSTSLMSSPSSTHGSSSSSSMPQCDLGSVIKVFAQVLSQDVEYITLHVNAKTKSNQIVKSLLKKFRLKHRDPNLYYLTLERWIRKDGLKFKSVMLLGDEACPLQLQQCCSNPPHNDIKFTLQSRTGALVKIFCSDVVPDARYKCLSLSTQTTVEETIELMLHCLNLAHAHPTTATSNDCTKTDHNSHTTTTTLNTASHHYHHLNNYSGSPSSSSSASSDSSSTSSGIESDSNNNNCKQNGHSSLPTMNNTGLDVVDSAYSHHNQMLDSDSRTSSVTSISSSSNVSNISNSIADQYCMIIECKDTNYKRILENGEYLVDVYQNLISEAKGQSTISSQYSDVVNSNHSTSETIKQQPEQWFHIKLKRRNEYNQNTIKSTSPRQSLPLPPVPLSLAQQYNNANNLKHIVSMTQIEVNHRPNYITSGSLAKLKASDSELFCKPDSLNSDLKQIPATGTTIANTTSKARAPPPPEFISLPPVRPRRRNLSNASSTFGRPLMVNRRRYDPAQLVEDLNKLNVREFIVESITANGSSKLLTAADNV